MEIANPPVERIRPPAVRRSAGNGDRDITATEGNVQINQSHLWEQKFVPNNYWPASNQLGPHTRQMNLGHRQDTLIAHHGDWNHTKTSKIVFDLAEDIEDAKTKYTENRNHFIALSISYSENVSQWQGLSRTPSKLGKEAVSVYKHDTTKGYKVGF
ncbi:hypothetical protein R3P38DRAFT_2793085 [Favolaschia claudopus]|uniref:Uncharacterized protein n=1 Tax=Favolaschia claudopus TaxID=2862362 RepID=A0AAW0AD97_9AGAR